MIDEDDDQVNITTQIFMSLTRIVSPTGRDRTGKALTAGICKRGEWALQKVFRYCEKTIMY